MHLPLSLSCALALSWFAILTHASPFEDLEDRAVEARVCSGYAVEQVSACPTNTQFCSQYLASHGPIITKTTQTTVIIGEPTTVYSYTTTITAITATQSSYGEICETGTARVKRAAPAAFGPQCNVKQIQPSKVENACSCLNGFKYQGKRPKATGTTTTTITTDLISQSLTTITTASTTTQTGLVYRVQPSSPALGPLNYLRLTINSGAVRDGVSVSFEGQTDNQNFFSNAEDNYIWYGTFTGNSSFWNLFTTDDNGSNFLVIYNTDGNPQTPPHNVGSGKVVRLTAKLTTSDEQGCAPHIKGTFEDGTPVNWYICDIGSGLYLATERSNSTVAPPPTCQLTDLYAVSSL